MNSISFFIHIFPFFSLKRWYLGWLIFFEVILCFDIKAQEIKLTPVLDQIDRISANFGELRNNHFHAGIDFKTGEKEGKPVFAAADGFVSRVKVSSSGYGKVLYITHPEKNVVTVYAHMRTFYPSLSDSIRKLQYESRKYEQEIFPYDVDFPVKAGMLIGFSGNTGFSLGPHLHFETRNRFSELPFNPELAGFEIADSIPPIISSLVIYKPGPESGLAGSLKQVVEIDHPFIVDARDSLTVNGPFFIGFESFDLAGQEVNKLGIRRFELSLDDSLIFDLQIDSFSFDETRMINSAIDYPFYIQTGRRIQLAHSLPGNKLSFYRNRSGIISLADYDYHQLKLEVFDTKGNSTVVTCMIKKVGGGYSQPPPEGIMIPFNKKLELSRKNYKVDIAPLTFYESVWLKINRKKNAQDELKEFSRTLEITPPDVAIHQSLKISMRVFEHDGIPDSNLVVGMTDSTGKITSAITGVYQNESINFTTRKTGTFVIVADTSAPKATLLLYATDDFSGSQKLHIMVNDDLSGIQSYNCFVDGNWVPAAFERNKLVIYPEDLHGSQQPFSVIVELIDYCGNRSETRL